MERDDHTARVYTGSWIVLADCGFDWPDVFGPWVNYREAVDFADDILEHPRCNRSEIIAISTTDLDIYFGDLLLREELVP